MLEAKEEKRLALHQEILSSLLPIFEQQAAQKINIEGWAKQGRNVQVKKDNFVHCWITEEAFKQILIKENKWFRNRGLYFGDAAGAGVDFIVKIGGKEVSIGLRSIAEDSLNKWKTVPYPDDRFQYEKEKIADFHVVCQRQGNVTFFFGMISKEELLTELAKSRRLYSPKNQEYFRVVPLEKFRLELLQEMLTKMS
ncbi:hypothetical protein J4210_06355 [Candidatus Woesearchaeota archaeon]|nr:hypothetical protein [Candidatus Woesearchaeota archaeon]